MTEALLVTLCCCGGLALFALAAGQDFNWDQRNYHLWAPFTLLSGDEDRHLAAASLQSWFNPLIHFPFYFSVTRMPPREAGALLGALAGLNGLLLWALARSLTRAWPRPAARLGTLAATLAGITGPVFLSEAGTSFVDNLTSLLTLAALLALVTALARETEPQAGDAGRRLWLTAGGLIGLAVGFKLTNVVFALGLLAALLATSRSFGDCRQRLGRFLPAALLGGALSGGWWMLHLFGRTGNPVFPLYNAVFHSPWFPEINFLDLRFLSKSPANALTYPFKWALGIYPVSTEGAFRDLRFLLVFLLLGMVLAVSACDRLSAGPDEPCRAPPRTGAAILWFLVFSFLPWIFLFGIHRYIVPLELICGVAVLVCLQRLDLAPNRQAALLLAFAGAGIAWQHSPEWGRLPWAERWVALRVEPDLSFEHTLLVLAGPGSHPMAYVLPHLPESATSVRLVGLDLSPAMERRMLAQIRTHDGPVRTLSGGPIDRAALAERGLTVSDEGCVRLETRFESLESCPVTVSRPAPPTPPAPRAPG
jgi:hypothetical protein